MENLIKLNCGEFSIINLNNLNNNDKYKYISLFKNNKYICKKENNNFLWKIPNTTNLLNTDNVLQQTFNYSKKETILFKYQQEDVDKLLNKNRCFLFHETGTGKTIIMLSLLCKLFKPDNKCLIVVPKSIILQWLKEIQKHTNFTYSSQNNAFLKKKEEYKLDNIKDYNTSDITLITYARLRKYKEQNNEYNFIIYDEATNLKNSRAQQTRGACNLFANYKYLLTATPIQNNPLDLYSLLKILDIEQFIFGSYWDFINKYAIREKVAYVNKPIITGWQNIKELGLNIKNISLYRNKTDVADQINAIFKYILQPRYITLTPKQLKFNSLLYAEIARLNNNRQSGDEINLKEWRDKYIVLIKLLILNADSSQLLVLSNSKVKNELFSEELLNTITTDDIGEKLNEINEILSEINGKTIIFTNYSKMANLIQKELNKKYKTHLITGITKNVEDILNDFRINKNINILITTNVLKYGINLQEAENIIMFDLPWTFAEYQQIIGRLVRIGQKKIVNVFKLIALNTFDERINEIIEDKKTFDEIIKENIIK